MTEPSQISLERLDHALATLRPLTREVFLLHRLDGLDYAQIAMRLDITVGDVERQIGDALAQLWRDLRRIETPWWQRWLR